MGLGNLIAQIETDSRQLRIVIAENMSESVPRYGR